MLNAPFSRKALVCALSLMLVGCATQPPATDAPRKAALEARAALSQELADAAARTQQPGDRAKIYTGSGVIVKGQQPGGTLPPAATVQATGAGIVLNFEDADLREVIRNILGDVLNESYTIDAAVGGRVTIRTSSGIPREALPATLETLLRMNGAAMVKEAGVWKILPQAAAVRGNVTPQLGNSQRALQPGYSVQIVPLRYVGVREMVRILEPFARDAAAIRADELRNMLVLSGTEIELRHLLETIDMFDIDWMSGMSAGVFTLQNADVKTVVQELDRVLGDRNNSPLTGILRIVPIERMNALLVISPNPHYIDEAKKWIDRLDAGTGEGVRFYVINLQNQRSERIAPLLQQAFTGRASQQQAAPPPSVAPGTPAGQIVSPPSFQPQATTPGAGNPAVPAAAAAAAGAIAANRAVGAGEGSGIVRNVQVVADKDQNTVLIVATPSEFSVIEQALRKLDVPQRQVMMEVTIAEVTLTDELKFGVEWLFKGGAPSGRGSGGLFNGSSPFNPAIPVGSLATGAAVPALGLAAGFNYILNNSNFLGGVQAVLNLLDTYGHTRVISNPHIAALDNQKATIKSGDRIPINQTTNVGGTNNALVTTTASYIDTGVLLQVTPHINAGGLVTLDVQAEVSQPRANSTTGSTDTSGNAPPISTRSVQTLVAVPSGRTMVMGGLITDVRGNTTAGLPGVSRIPWLGGLFGTQDRKDDRTELVVFITPRVIDGESDNEAIINDLRRRMEGLDRAFPGTSTWPASPPSIQDRVPRWLSPERFELPPLSKPLEPMPPAPAAGQPARGPLTQTDVSPAPSQPATPAPKN